MEKYMMNMLVRVVIVVMLDKSKKQILHPDARRSFYTFKVSVFIDGVLN